jgi:alpha-tubulin suppressor-like RCC1 family protein
MTRSIQAALLVTAAVLAACQDPLLPRASLPTLDDPASDDFAMVSAGKEHTCALTLDGSAYCWGSNEGGQLGVAIGDTRCERDGRPIPCEPRPVVVSGGLAFRKISAGALHSCALTSTGRAYCWGDNLLGQLGDPALRAAFTPMPIASADAFVDIAAGAYHTCAVRTDGVVFCWGANVDGQLGVSSVGAGSAVPVAVQTAQRFATVSSGARRSCARGIDGSVFCWGATWIARQNGTEVVHTESAPVRLPTPDTRTIAVGTSSTCAISAEDTAYCWEANPSGTLGNGTTIGSTLPIQVKFSGTAVAISVGEAHACAVAASGRAYCWGADAVGQLGISPGLLNVRCVSGFMCSLTPTAVAGWRLFTDISAGLGNHTCALGLRGTVYCWGAGGMGQRGDGRLSNEWAPIRVVRP